MNGEGIADTILRLREQVYQTTGEVAETIEVTLPDNAYDQLSLWGKGKAAVTFHNAKENPSLTVYGVKVWRRGSYSLK